VDSGEEFMGLDHHGGGEECVGGDVEHVLRWIWEERK
jgi:hypothetical protein